MAFVDLSEADDLSKALALNGTELKGSALRIEKSTPKTAKGKQEGESKAHTRAGLKVQGLAEEARLAGGWRCFIKFHFTYSDTGCSKAVANYDDAHTSNTIAK